MIRIGTAGWSIPARYRHLLPETGSGLERYAARFNAAEINSSFYRPHKPETYGRWAAAVPEEFPFSVKLPKAITHERRLADAADPLDRFLAEVTALGTTLGPVLIQLPSSLAYNKAMAAAFLQQFRARFRGAAVCEPRHPTWFTTEAEQLLAAHEIARRGRPGQGARDGPSRRSGGPRLLPPARLAADVSLGL